jgi:cystathionine beta-synthase
MYLNSIIESVGNTPLVKHQTLSKENRGTILVKVEYFNPGNSIKDRIAIKMIEDAEKKGLLKPGGTIVEGTSGNTGMGLALVAIAKGYKCIFTTTDKQSQSKIDILKAMGAEVLVCPTNVEPEDPQSYYSVAARLARETENCYYPNQYDNKSNLIAHYESTGPEIWEQTEGKITHYVAGMGTGGTISGVGKYLKERNPEIKVIGIDSVGSVYKKYFETGIFDKNEIKPYMTEGIGEDIIPGTIEFDNIDYVVQVDDKVSALETRSLAKDEGLFVGWSCGAAVAGAKKYIEENRLNDNDVMVIVLPDSGTRYIGKVYNDEWMKEQGFLD